MMALYNSNIAFFAFLILCLAIGRNRNIYIQDFNFGEPPANYDVLALKRCNATDGFSIHGLWAEYTPTSWPSFCNRSDPLRFRNIYNMTDELKEKWYSCDNDLPVFMFWNHEWLKHGTCFPGVSQRAYFEKTVELYDEIPWETMCNPNKFQCLIPLNRI